MKTIRLLTTLAGVSAFWITNPASAQDTPAETPIEEETPSEKPEPDAPKKPDSHADKIKRLEEQKELLDKKKEVRDSQAALATAAFGPLGTYQGAQGTVTLDDANRSVFETTLLAARAVDHAADEMGVRLARVIQQADKHSAQNAAAQVLQSVVLPPVSQMGTDQLCEEATSINLLIPPLAATRPVVFVSQSTAVATDLADSFAVSTSAVAHQLCDALLAPTAELSGGSLAAAGAALNTVANLLRADYSVYGLSLTPDQSLLTKRVASKYMFTAGNSHPVYLPDLSPFNLRDERNPAARRLLVMERIRSAASLKARSDDAMKVVLEQAIGVYDELRTGLTTANDDKPPLITSIFRQAAVAGLLDQGGYLVVTNIHMLGGTSYTKKNFFTFIGGMPYFVSGGGITSYLVQDGLSGPVLDTVTYPVTSGFHRVNQIHASFKRR
jgi:hypothetical protein